MNVDKWIIRIKKSYLAIRNIMVLAIVFRVLFLDTDKLNIIKPILIETLELLV